MSDASEAAWSCVVDDTPGIWASIVPWLATAIHLAGISPSHIHVHHVCALQPGVADLCRTLAVHTHRIDPFDRRHPYTNKIRQCATAFPACRKVVLTDVDIVFASRPPVGGIQPPVAGKLVDLPNPPLAVLRTVFAASGVPCPDICTGEFVDATAARVSFETLGGNCNGGVYVIDRELLGHMGTAWARWAHWLIAHIDLLDRWAVHVDQVAFCLAVTEMGLPVAHLDAAWNFPLHLDVAHEGGEPCILHHHVLFDSQGRLRPSTISRAGDTIARVNRVIEACRDWCR